MAVTKRTKKTSKAKAPVRRTTKTTATKGKRTAKRSASRAKTTAPKGKRTTKRSASRAKAAPQLESTGFSVSRASVARAVQNAPKHVLIFLPGWMGSSLVDPDGNTVWLDFGRILRFASPQAWFDSTFQEMQFPHPTVGFQLTPQRVLENLFGALPFGQHYSRLKSLLQGWGYKIDPPLPTPANPDNLQNLVCYTFAYDWRRDLREAAVKLKDRVDQLKRVYPQREIWLMGHSGGGIVSRWYLRHLGGEAEVKRLFLLASPWDGAPSALYFLMHGYDKLFNLPITLFDIPARTRAALRSFPSIYQIMPQSRDFLMTSAGGQVNPFDDADWLPDPAHRQMLLAGRQFNRELGNEVHVPTVAFVGYNKETRTGGQMTSAGATRWENLHWNDAELLGDGTVPIYSAEYTRSLAGDEVRLVHVIAAHADIYADSEAQKELYRELLGKFAPSLETEIITVRRATDAAIKIAPVEPKVGERVALTVTLTVRRADPAANAPLDEREHVAGGKVAARLHWVQLLPLSQKNEPKKRVRSITLKRDREVPGRYTGSFAAPAPEGIYELETVVQVPGEPVFTLKEIVVIEPKPAEMKSGDTDSTSLA